MKQSTKKFYRQGVGKQAKADVSFDVRRVDAKKIKEWTVEQNGIETTSELCKRLNPKWAEQADTPVDEKDKNS